VAVAIVVDEGTARPPVGAAGAEQTSLGCHVRERAIAVVAVQDVLAEIGDEEIVETVIVVVADGNAGGPAGLGKPSLRCDVGEGSITVVLIEPVGSSRRRILEAGPAQYEDVEPAVIVVIEESDATPHRLNDVVLLVRGPVNRWSGQAGS